MKLSRLTPVVFIVWLVFYMFGNNMLPVTDPVESNYALTAKEMVLSGDWLSPQIYGTYWYDKPIMIYWLIALGFKIFGIADWVVRLPSAIFGALSVATMYQSTRTMSGKWALGLIGASVLGTSLMFWTVAHGVITDMVLLYTTLMVMIYSYKGLVEQKPYAMIVAYVFAALGVLTKGPVAIVLPGMILLVFAGINRSWSMVKAIFDWRGILAFCVVCLPWYVYMYSVHGQDFINGFLGLHNVTRATQSEHPEDNVWWYYLAIFLGASMPWTGAVIYGIIDGFKQRHTGFIYNMTWGVGIVLFYTLMATKYPLYTFVSLVPFMEGLEPFVKQRSNIDVVPVVDSYEGDVYYYNGYSTAVVYYTGHKVIKINGDESRWDDRDKLKKRSAEWQKKYLMEQVSEEEFNKTIESGKPLMLIVPKGEIKHFRQSSIYPHVSESSEAGTSEVYVLNKKTLFK